MYSFQPVKCIYLAPLSKEQYDKSPAGVEIHRKTKFLRHVWMSDNSAWLLAGDVILWELSLSLSTLSRKQKEHFTHTHTHKIRILVIFPKFVSHKHDKSKCCSHFHILWSPFNVLYFPFLVNSFFKAQPKATYPGGILVCFL